MIRIDIDNDRLDVLKWRKFDSLMSVKLKSSVIIRSFMHCDYEHAAKWSTTLRCKLSKMLCCVWSFSTCMLRHSVIARFFSFIMFDNVLYNENEKILQNVSQKQNTYSRIANMFVS